MAAVPLGQLNAATRKRLCDQLTGLGVSVPGRRRPRPSRADSAGQPCPGRCGGPHGCGTPFESYARWERHRDVSGCHGRWQIDLPGGINP